MNEHDDQPWVEDGKPVWRSFNEAYSRHAQVYRKKVMCDVCREPERVCLSVDTSDDEYLRFQCCATCFVRLATA